MHCTVQKMSNSDMLDLQAASVSALQHYLLVRNRIGQHNSSLCVTGIDCTNAQTELN